MRNPISNSTYPMILAGYIIAALVLLFFSYTQVDLNLTLSQVSIWQGLQKAFQYVGFYQRPFSTGIYASILVILFTSYFLLLRAVHKKSVSIKAVWRLVFIVSCILVFSYPAAFSYDFFNYMFTAKTVLVYQQNPYTVIPLQFKSIDPWTNFMRWTHLPSAYTPLWIGLSLIPYIMGFGYFILVLFATKFLVAGFYLVACYALVRTMTLIDEKRTTYALAFFALNPLILIESLVSGHNDIILAALVLISVWAYAKKDTILAWFSLALSIAMKFMTIFLIPVYLLKKGKEWMLGIMLVGLAFVLWRREFLPWYWVWIMPFVALQAPSKKLTMSASIISLGLLLSYAPYIYFGEYSAIEQAWKTALIWTSVGISGAVLLIPTRQRASHS